MSIVAPLFASNSPLKVAVSDTVKVPVIDEFFNNSIELPAELNFKFPVEVSMVLFSVIPNWILSIDAPLFASNKPLKVAVLVTVNVPLNVEFSATDNPPQTFKFLPTPTPPATIIAPVVQFVD